MASWLKLEDIVRKTGLSESEILMRRAIKDIGYSEKTDKYNLDSLIEQRTMTIGIEKFLSSEEKAVLITQMDNYSTLFFKLFRRAQDGEVFASSGTDRQHRVLAKEFGFGNVVADSAASMAGGLAKSSVTWKAKHEANLEEKIKSLQTKIAELENPSKKPVSKLTQSLQNKQRKLRISQAKDHKSVWFGNKKPEEKELYQKSRLSLFVSGTAGVGNSKYGVVLGENGYALKLDKLMIQDIKISPRGPSLAPQFTLPSSHKDTFSLDGFNRQSSRISFNKKGKLVLNITYSYIKPIKLSNIERSAGTIGIDIGPKEIAVCYVKNDGNPHHYTHHNIGSLQDARTEDRQRILSKILDSILEEGLEIGFTHVSIENLERLSFKKTGNSNLNRMLAKFPTKIFESLIISKCARNGLKLRFVNPAYTSMIGLLKYAHRDHLSTSHHSNSKDLSAALVIGRRGLGLKERNVVCFTQYRKDYSFTASSLFPEAEQERNTAGGRNSFEFWRELLRRLKFVRSQTGNLKGRNFVLDSSPALLADILNMSASACRNSGAHPTEVSEDELPF